MAKIVVIGGTGLIGSKVVSKLQAFGHEAVAASPNTGVNTITGEGLAEALAGADVVVDVSNSPSFAPKDVMDFFVTGTTNVLAAEKAAGVKHHVALTIVGTKPGVNAYFDAKVAQEKLIRESGVPYSLVHATQFLEFVGAVADVSTVDGVVRLPGGFVQPIAAEDVATAVADTAANKHAVGDIEIAGPEAFGLDEWVRRALAFRGDSRQVIRDDAALYYGGPIDERTLVPFDGDAWIFETRLEDWLPANPPRS